SDVVVVEAITHADIRSGLNMAKNSPPKATTVAAAPPAPARAPVTPSPAPAVRQVAGPAPAGAASLPASAAKPSTPTPDALAVLDQKHAQTFTEARSPSPTVTTDSDEGIYLQFGAFGSYISADRLANQLNRDIAQVETLSAHVQSG